MNRITSKEILKTADKSLESQKLRLVDKQDITKSDRQRTASLEIKASELISLSKSAKITGEITTNRLAIEPGAVFSGTCNMDSSSSSSTYSAPSVSSNNNDEKRK